MVDEHFAPTVLCGCLGLTFRTCVLFFRNGFRGGACQGGASSWGGFDAPGTHPSVHIVEVPSSLSNDKTESSPQAVWAIGGF